MEIAYLQNQSTRDLTQKSSIDDEEQQGLIKELENGLAKYDLEDASKLQEEIEEKKKQIQNLENKKQINKAKERRKSLQELEYLQSIYTKLEEQKDSSNQEILSQKEQLQKELNDGLAKYEIQDAFKLSEEIEEKKTQIDGLKKKNHNKKALERQKSLDELEYLQSISIKLEELKSLSNLQNMEQLEKELKDYQSRYDLINQKDSIKSENRDDSKRGLSNYLNKLISSLNELQEDLSLIPESCERSLLQIIYYTVLLISGKQTCVDSQINIDKNEILNQFNIMKDRLKIEELRSQEVKGLLVDIETKINSEDWENTIFDSQKLLKKIRPLNIQEIKRLIQKTIEAAKLIQGQDIILFIGGTGAGKSTIIHFLAGSKMVEKQIQVSADKFDKYIGPDTENIQNKALLKVNVSGHAQSETRYITPVTVNFSDIGMFTKGSIVLCDSPGHGDTAGPEVDIANGIGILQAIKGCKSVRPVILASFKSVGDRGEGIKKLGHLLVGFIVGIQDKLSSFSYLFTKYPPNTDIHVSLLNIKNSIDKNQEESSNDPFVALFDDMLEKTQEKALSVDPLKDKPKELLKQLINTPSIQNPQESFQFSITESSKSSIHEQVRLHQFSIISASKRMEYKLIKYKLDEMVFLINMLNSDFIKQAYTESVRLIIDGLNKDYSDTISLFNLCLDNQNILTDKDIQQYQKRIAQFKEAESLRDSHLGTEVVQTSSLIQNLLSMVKTITERFEQNMCNKTLKNNLDSIKLLSDEFTEVKPDYNHLCQTLQVKFENFVTSSQELLNKNEFNRFAEALQQIKQYTLLLKNHLDVNQMQMQYNNIGNSLISHLNQICRSVDPILKQMVDESNIEILKQAISILMSAKETIELREHINMDEIKSIIEQLNQKIINHQESINQKIDELFKNEAENSFKEIEVQVRQMDLIRQIQGVDSKTSELYHKTVQEVFGYMKQLSRDVEQLLTYFHQQPENLNYKKIYRCLSGLKNTQWMDNIRKGGYADVMRNISEDIVKHAQKLQEKLLDIDLDLNHSNNIYSAYQIIMQLESMRQFELTISELSQYREYTNKKFNDGIQNTFNQIQSAFNLESKGVYQQKLVLKNLEAIKSEYEEYNPERLYIKEKGFENIDFLTEQIILIEQQKTKFLNKIENDKKMNQDQYDKLNDIAQKFLDSKKKQGTNINQQQNNQLLKEVECNNINELYEKIELIQQEISKLPGSQLQYTHKYQKEKERLDSMQLEYNEILKSKKTSPQGEDFLLKKNYQNIKALEKEISCQNQNIQHSESQDLDYVFNRLDGVIAENAMLYLNACKKIRPFKVEAEQTFQKLKNYITKYCEFISKEMKSCFYKVNNATPTEINEVFGHAQRLANFLQGICELDQYQQIFQLIQGKVIISEWQTKLSNNLIQLTDQMNQGSLDKQDFRNKLDIIKAFSQIDFLLNDKKYFDLYRQFQNAACNEFKEIYKRIINLIEKNDFQKVSIELFEIDDKPVNERALNQINHMINVSVMDLVGQAKTKAIMLGNNLEIGTIQSIVDNLKQIENAKKHIPGYQSNFSQQKIISQEINTQFLENGFKEIQDIVQKKIINYLQSIEALINVSDFYEAEEKREYINQVRHLLGSYCVNEELSNKIECLQNTIEDIVEKVLEKYDKMPTQDYILNPPKYILDKLQKVASRSIKYTQSLNIIKEKIVKKIREILKEVKESTPDERNEHIQRVETALCSIPDEMKKALEIELETFKKLLIQKEEFYKDDYQRAISCGDLKVVNRFMEKCSRDGMHSFLNLVQQEIVRQVLKCKENIKNELCDENLKQALDQLKKMLEYKEVFGRTILEIENTFIDVQVQVINKLSKLFQFLMSISQVENNEQFEKSFENFILFLDFKNETSTIKSSIIISGVDFDSKIQQLYQKLSEYFIENQQKYEKCLETLNIQQLNESISLIQKWNTLLKKIKSFSEMQKDQPIQDLTKIVEKCKLYPEVIIDITQLLKVLKTEILSFEFLQDCEEQRNKFYQKFENKLRALKEFKEFKDHFKGGTFDLESYEKECLPFLKEKLQKASNTSIKMIEGDSKLSKQDFDSFRIFYENILSFELNIRNSDIQAKKFMENISQKIDEKIEQLIKTIQNSSQVSQVASTLIELKSYSDNIPSQKFIIDQKIDDFLKFYRQKHKGDGGKSLVMLITVLKQDTNGIGHILISEHKCFKGQAISIFNTNTQIHGIGYVLEKLEGNMLNKDKLQKIYFEFRELYDTLVTTNLTRLEIKDQSEPITNELIAKIKMISQGTKHKLNKINWDQSIRNKIPSLMAHIFALWTLKNSEYYIELKGLENRESYLLQPHPGQILAILRLLGIGYDVEGLTNNLIEIGTGEGKSITLAVSSSILALFGIDVSCACYSQYLSDRDYQQFLQIFDSLGITEYIKYGPFNKICDNIINEQGDIRQRIINLITTDSDDIYKKSKDINQRPKVLLIDEADVFLSKDFYGNIYNPMARLKDSTICRLTNYIWQNRNQNLTFKRIEQTTEYKECCAKFKNWEFLIEEAVKDMLSDFTNFMHSYIVQQDKIAYKEQDGISFDIVYGYKTLFAYYFEYEKGKISKNSLNENIFIGIRCGSFSYAQIPHTFQYMMGVTGTLKTLNQSEIDILSEVYKIKNNTFIPSVFGINKRVFGKESDVFVENTENYFMRIKDQIMYKMMGKEKRAVLVFFETKEKLMEFKNSQQLAPIKDSVQVITEEFSNKERDSAIKRAATSGQITLLSRIYGRGTDFICHDQNVLCNGGVHVISAFLSENLSEEIQIMGRSARQGEDGSFSIIVLDEDLEKFLGSTYRDDIEQLRSKSKLYEGLNKIRNEISLNKYQDTNEYIKIAEKEHIEAKKLIQSLNENNVEYVQQFLGERNKGSTNNDSVSRIICLMDATGSMNKLLQQVKNSVETMFQRASLILKQNTIPEDSFKIQFVVYRDYDSLIEGILQSSPWEAKPENLRKFLEGIKAQGGDDYEEAIEIGLQHVNQESNEQEISQVILIGDAPAKQQDKIIEDRKKFGGEQYWNDSKFKDITFYKTEVEKLKQKGIPVHTFYLAEGAKSNFEEIANSSGGRSSYLNIESSESSDLLTNIVTEQILKSVGHASGKGDELVEAYREKYAKSYK